VCPGPRDDPYKYQPPRHMGDRIGLRHAVQKAVARAYSLGQEGSRTRSQDQTSVWSIELCIAMALRARIARRKPRPQVLPPGRPISLPSGLSLRGRFRSHHHPRRPSHMDASIRKAHGCVFQCPVCDFTVQRMADLKVRELGAKIADHYGTHLDGRDQAGVLAHPKPEATEIRGRGRQQILREVPESQSPEPEIAPTHPLARPLKQLYLSSKPLSPPLVAPRPRK
jgi:hypothetical protein